MADVAQSVPAPPAHHGSHRRVETPDERKARKDREARKEKERRDQEARQRSKQTDANVKASHDNRLTRHTPFMCNVRFTNDLPEIPCDPKMLVTPLQPKQLAEFQVTSLEREPKRDLVFEPDLGIQVSLLDVQKYVAPEVPPPLDPADAALIQDDDDGVDVGPGGNKVRDRLRGQKAELSWLMRTTYISNDFTAKRKATFAQRSKQEDEVLELDDREAQIAAIEASFAAAQQAPVHFKNPALKPMEILPVLPDLENWGNNYVLVSFDNDPASEAGQFAKHPSETRELVAEHGVLKRYTCGTDQFVDYLVPNQAPVADEDGSVDPSELEGEYDWVREYGYKVDRDERAATYLLCLGASAATYNDLNVKLKLQRRKKAALDMRNMSDQQQEEWQTKMQRPAKITLKRRGMMEDEAAEHASKVARLTSQDGEVYGDMYQGQEGDVRGDGGSAVLERQRQDEDDPHAGLADEYSD